MPYTVLRGRFVIRYPDLPRQGPEPDGDTVKFVPDTPVLVEGLPRRSGRPPKINARGVSVRLEAIDALETHFDETHQELPGANDARDELLRRLGFTGVEFFPDLPNKVRAADQDSLPGHVLSNGVDANGRLIGFVYPGEHPGPDGAAVFVDDTVVDASVNAQLLAAGYVYPAFYATLPATLRAHLADTSRTARAAGTGLWPRSVADPDGAATVTGLPGLQRLVLWPKLFRRIVPYLASGHANFDGFDGWLRADPVNRDDAVFLLDKLEAGNLHDVIRAGATASSSPRGRKTSSSTPTRPRPAPPPAPARHDRRRADPGRAARPGRRGPRPRNRHPHRHQPGRGRPCRLEPRRRVRRPAAPDRHPRRRSHPPGHRDGAGCSSATRGYSIILEDATGATIDQVTYKQDQVRTGHTICFGRTT